MSTGRILAFGAAFVVATVLVVFGIIYLMGGGPDTETSAPVTVEKAPVQPARKADRPEKAPSKSGTHGVSRVDNPSPAVSVSSADEKTCDEIDELAQKEDGKALLAEDERFLKNDSAAVREHYLDTLGSTDAGKSLEAVAVYQVALGDVNEDVRQQAGMKIVDAISDVPDDGTRITYAESSLARVRDEVSASAIAQLYSSAGNEQLALKSIVRVLGGHPSAAVEAALKDVYEVIKGEPYSQP